MKSSPYLRTFAVGAIWYAAIAIKGVYESGSWTTYPPGKLAILVVAWIVTALLLGVVATKFEKFRSWWDIGFGTVVGSIAVLGLMLLMAENTPPPGPKVPHFKNTDEMMQYLASQAVQMADENNGVKLDYSPDSIKDVEKVLGSIHDEYQRTNTTEGMRGLAMAYGAYIGEVIRRSEPGAKWEQSDSVGGDNSYPLTWRGGSSYVVAWCYKRIANGDEDNVWFKYISIRDHDWSGATVQHLASTNGAPAFHSSTNPPIH